MSLPCIILEVITILNILQKKEQRLNQVRSDRKKATEAAETDGTLKSNVI